MNPTKQTLQQTLQLIVDMLRFDTKDALEKQLYAKEIDWDAIVITASQHLVLPAVYCRLQQKQLLHYLPIELAAYLEELTNLNRDRNYAIYEELHQISKLFNTHQINHVFIKGGALLAGKYVKDFGERMIGDIDILVDSKQLDVAFEMLTRSGYNKTVPFNYETKNYRHLPRQINANKIGAIELHDQLLKHRYNHLIDKERFLAKKVIVDGISVPNSSDLIKNTIFAQQVNDRAYYYNNFKLKGFYDVLVAGLSEKRELISELSKQKYGRGFFSLVSIFYPLYLLSNDIKLSQSRKKSYLFFINHPKWRRLHLKLKRLYILFKDRISLMLINKSYRSHIIKNKLINKHETH